jgi:hypothetical protein
MALNPVFSFWQKNFFTTFTLFLTSTLDVRFKENYRQLQTSKWCKGVVFHPQMLIKGCGQQKTMFNHHEICKP